MTSSSGPTARVKYHISYAGWGAPLPPAGERWSVVSGRQSQATNDKLAEGYRPAPHRIAGAPCQGDAGRASAPGPRPWLMQACAELLIG